MKHLCFLTLLISFFTGCNGQVNQAVAITRPDVDSIAPDYYGIPDNIASVDTSAGWSQPGQKMLITGTVYQQDGRTPAPGILIYYYHTNTAGKYLHKDDEIRSLPPNRQGQTHGYLRGWVKTGSDGKYSIYTVRPGSYPSGDEPAHIHLTIKEPGMEKNYYVDDLVFDDDKLLTTARRRKMENRGGSGVLRMLQMDDLQIAEHNIILGLNIPGYPKTTSKAKIQSGLQVGEDQPSFIPFHAFGPDKGTRACPVCKYGRYHGIVYFVGNNPNWNDIKKWLVFLEKESNVRNKYLKAYFVYGNSKNYNKTTRLKELEKIGLELNLKMVALTFVPSFHDAESEANLNSINPAVENTFIIYKNRTIVEKFINLEPTESNFNLVSTVLDKTRGEYFHLPEPKHN